MQYVKVIESRDAVEFLNQLSLRAPAFVAERPYTWLFRGHSSETWGMLPSAFRPNPALAVGPTPPERAWEAWTNEDQILFEAATIQQFAAEVDGAGLEVPNEGPDLRSALADPFEYDYGKRIERGDVEWPPRLAWPLVALAQHYGLATRFLDWSYSPYVASYFAAADAVEADEAGGRIAVWAFSARARFAYWGLLSPFGALPDQYPELVPTPYAGNPNLRAQEGVHVALRVSRIQWEGRAERPDFLESFLRIAESDQGSGHEALIKFVLPAASATELLWHLAKERVTPARLFPGYAGAARSVLQRNKWPTT